jgi:hypothetical protein
LEFGGFVASKMHKNNRPRNMPEVKLTNSGKALACRYFPIFGEVSIITD